MNTIAARRNLALNAIGALLIAAVFALGATLGHFTNTGQPAHAKTPATDVCAALCAGSTITGGNVSISTDPSNTSAAAPTK